MTDRPIKLIDIIIPGYLHTSNGRKIPIGGPASEFLTLYESIHVLGIDRTIRLIRFGLTLNDRAAGAGVANTQAFIEKAIIELANMFANIFSAQGYAQEYETAQLLQKNKPNHVLGLTYGLLQGRIINHAKAAELASQLLGQTYTEDAWRRRVARWAKAQGLPPLELKRGRPPKKKPST